MSYFLWLNPNSIPYTGYKIFVECKNMVLFFINGLYTLVWRSIGLFVLDVKVQFLFIYLKMHGSHSNLHNTSMVENLTEKGKLFDGEAIGEKKNHFQSQSFSRLKRPWARECTSKTQALHPIAQATKEEILEF